MGAPNFIPQITCMKPNIHFWSESTLQKQSWLEYSTFSTQLNHTYLGQAQDFKSVGHTTYQTTLAQENSHRRRAPQDSQNIKTLWDLEAIERFADFSGCSLAFFLGKKDTVKTNLRRRGGRKEGERRRRWNSIINRFNIHIANSKSIYCQQHRHEQHIYQQHYTTVQTAIISLASILKQTPTKQKHKHIHTKTGNPNNVQRLAGRKKNDIVFMPVVHIYICYI